MFGSDVSLILEQEFFSFYLQSRIYCFAIKCRVVNNESYMYSCLICCIS